MRGSTLRKWSSDGCTFEGVVWQHLQLMGFEDRDGIFEHPTWYDLEIGEPRWRKTLLRQPELERVAFSGGTMTAVSFVESDATGLNWRGTALDGLELLLGSFQGLTFDTYYAVRIRETCLRDTAVSQGEPRTVTHELQDEWLIATLLRMNGPTLRGQDGRGTYCFAMGESGSDTSRIELTQPIRAYHPLCLYPKGEIAPANFGHVADMHINSRQDLLRGSLMTTEQWETRRRLGVY